MNKSCQVMVDGKVLNEDKKGSTLYHAKIYGDKLLTAKLSKQISCAIKYLPLREGGLDVETEC